MLHAYAPSIILTVQTRANIRALYETGHGHDNNGSPMGKARLEQGVLRKYHGAGFREDQGVKGGILSLMHIVTQNAITRAEYALGAIKEAVGKAAASNT